MQGHTTIFWWLESPTTRGWPIIKPYRTCPRSVDWADVLKTIDHLQVTYWSHPSIDSLPHSWSVLSNWCARLFRTTCHFPASVLANIFQTSCIWYIVAEKPNTGIWNTDHDIMDDRLQGVLKRLIPQRQGTPPMPTLIHPNFFWHRTIYIAYHRITPGQRSHLHKYFNAVQWDLAAGCHVISWNNGSPEYKRRLLVEANVATLILVSDFATWKVYLVNFFAILQWWLGLECKALNPSILYASGYVGSLYVSPFLIRGSALKLCRGRYGFSWMGLMRRG